MPDARQEPLVMTVSVRSHDPLESTRPGDRAKLATLVVMAGIGGYVDAVSYLWLGRVFTAAMTGNTVLLALAIAAGDRSAVLRSATALLGFVGGVALGQLVVGRGEARTHWPRAVGAGLVVELGLLAMLSVGWYLIARGQGEPSVAGPATPLLVALSSLAMGVQSATARQLGVAAVSTTYVTGTLASLTSGTVEWLRSSRPERSQGAHAPQDVAARQVAVHGPALPAAAWAVYALGALAGVLLVMVAPTLAMLPVLVAVALLAVTDLLGDR